MFEQWLQVYACSSLFEGIEPQEAAAMLECWRQPVEMYHRNQFVFLTGDAVRTAGLVLSGKLAVVKENLRGQQSLVAILKPGELLGEVALFGGVSQYPSSARALTDSVVVYLSREVLSAGCSKNCPRHRQLIDNMLGILAKKALLLNKKVEYLSIRHVRARVCAFLHEHQQGSGSLQFNIPLTRLEMADYLGIPRPSLSRVLGALREEGILSFHRSQFQILDVDSFWENLV